MFSLLTKIRNRGKRTDNGNIVTIFFFSENVNQANTKNIKVKMMLHPFETMTFYKRISSSDSSQYATKFGLAVPDSISLRTVSPNTELFLCSL